MILYVTHFEMIYFESWANKYLDVVIILKTSENRISDIKVVRLELKVTSWESRSVGDQLVRI